MSDRNPYEKLGLSEDASFEEIQDARNRLCQAVTSGEDGMAAESIEAAYDAILMERLRLRQEGQLEVPQGIRYPERAVATTEPTPPGEASQLPEWLQGLLDSPDSSELAISGGIYAVFALLTLVHLSGGGTSLAPESWVLTSAFVATAYLLNRKEKRFWRSLLLASLGLFVGFGVGVLLAPVAANGLQAEYFASLVTLFFLWVVASFCR